MRASFWTALSSIGATRMFTLPTRICGRKTLRLSGGVTLENNLFLNMAYQLVNLYLNRTASTTGEVTDDEWNQVRELLGPRQASEAQGDFRPRKTLRTARPPNTFGVRKAC